jgi:protein CpxP
MKNTFSPRRIVVAVTLALGLTAAVFAAPPQAEGPVGGGINGMGGMGGPGAMHGMHERHRDHGMKEMARLHDELKLDSQQEALWKAAEKAGQDSRVGMHERFSKHHDEMLAQLSQPGADLRAVLKRMDEFRAEGEKQREASRDQWLKVYDALGAGQKEKARLFFKSKLEQAKEFGRRAPRKN